MVRKFLLVVIFSAILITPVVLTGVEVDWVLGDVRYTHLKSEWEELNPGMTLISGDRVQTGPGGETILLDGDGEIHILENTSFTVSEKYENAKRKSAFMLFLGRMKFKLGKSKQEEPDIQTQAVNLAIRGTEFEVGSGYDGSTIVLMEEGSVAVQGDTEELVLGVGEGTEVRFGDEPAEKFDVMTKVIDWDAWFDTSKEAVKGNEVELLTRILTKMEDISSRIAEYEETRADSLKKKDEYLALRDKHAGEGDEEKAASYSRMAGTESKRAYHSLVNIRFLALSAVGLSDMAQRIYTGMEEPTEEADQLYENIQDRYRSIEEKYIWEGDRERLEKKAEKKRGCLRAF